MQKKKLVIAISIIIITGVAIGILSISQDSLPQDVDPVLVLPYTDETHLIGIQGYGSSLGFFHNGIDFIFNDQFSMKTC